MRGRWILGHRFSELLDVGGDHVCGGITAPLHLALGAFPALQEVAETFRP